MDMAKMEMSVEDEPLIVVDETEKDDWMEVARSLPAAGIDSAAAADFAPCPVSPQDEFHPVGLDDELVWDSGDYTDRGEFIKSLEDEVANLKANPRINNLQRLPCICHTLQVRKHVT